MLSSVMVAVNVEVGDCARGPWRSQTRPQTFFADAFLDHFEPSSGWDYIEVRWNPRSLSQNTSIAAAVVLDFLEAKVEESTVRDSHRKYIISTHNCPTSSISDDPITNRDRNQSCSTLQ